MTTNTNVAPPGWHPDPSNPNVALRWWDGSAWTTHTRQALATTQQPVVTVPRVVTMPPAAWPGGSATITPNHGTASYSSGVPAPSSSSFAKRNSQSLTAIGVAVLYVLLAATTHFVLIGILPILLSVRAIKAKETLAPAAVAAAVVALVVAFAALQ